MPVRQNFNIAIFIIGGQLVGVAVKDAQRIDEADKIKLDTNYRAPDGLERLAANLYETLPPLIETVKPLVPSIR